MNHCHYENDLQIIGMECEQAQRTLEKKDYFHKNTNLFLEVEISRKSYGRELFKPLSEDAVFLAKMMSILNFTKQQLMDCKNFGWEVKVKVEEYILE